MAILDVNLAQTPVVRQNGTQIHQVVFNLIADTSEALGQRGKITVNTSRTHIGKPLPRLKC